MILGEGEIKFPLKKKKKLKIIFTFIYITPKHFVNKK
jgi:hypothetical protein